MSAANGRPHMRKHSFLASVILCWCAAGCTALLDGRMHPTALPAQAFDEWPTYGHDYANTRHVELTQIDARNVASLEPAWRYTLDASGPMESSPVVHDGIIYVTSAERDGVVALDASSGALRWQFWPKLTRFFVCCSKANRGVAVAGGRAFVATLDGHLVALDAVTGKQLWSQAIGDPRAGFSETAAPLAWRDMVTIGSAGSEFGIRGSYSALRQSDGKLLWRWWATNPGWEGSYVKRVNGHSLHRDTARERANAPRYRDAWRHGGGTVWMTPALDPASATIYLSTGNPAPDYNGDMRPGDNLYTDSIVALDARTGAMRWFYQEVPHDLWDYDAGSPPFLFGALDARGRLVAAVGEASKTGWLYILDRSTGKVVRISDGIVPQRRIFQTSAGMIEPGGAGGALGPSSYDPRRHRAFVVAVERPEIWEPQPAQPFEPGKEWKAGLVHMTIGALNYVDAVDVDTGHVVWRRYLSGARGQHTNVGFISGSLSAGDIVFVAEPTGALFALSADTGHVLWHYEIAQTFKRPAPSWRDRFADFIGGIFGRRAVQVSASPTIAHLDAPPIRYVAAGREYIAVCADVTSDGVERNVVLAFALPR